MNLGELTERLIRLRDRSDERVDRDALAVAINRLTAVEALATEELGMAPRDSLDEARRDFAQTIHATLEGD